MAEEKNENGELVNCVNKRNNRVSDKNKKRLKYGLITVLAATAITLTTVFTYRALNSGDVTLALNAGIGSFGNNLIRKKINVKKGTHFNDVIEVSTDIPVFDDINGPTVSISLPCSYWVKNDDNAIIPMNYTIDSNIELIAKYFDNLIGLKGMYLGAIGDLIVRLYTQSQNEELLNFGNKVKNKILSFENESQVAGYSFAFFKALAILTSLQESITIVEKYFYNFCNFIETYQDQRAQALGKIVATLFQDTSFMSLFPDDIATVYRDSVIKTLNNIVIDYAYLYHSIHENFMNAYIVHSTSEQIESILFNAIKYFSTVFEKVTDFSKIQYATGIINGFFIKASSQGISENLVSALYQDAKRLVEEIL